jgi:hypothetical protein
VTAPGEKEGEMDRRSMVMSVVLFTLIAIPLAAAAEGEFRVGVYDSRGVAIAYGNCGEFKAKIDQMKAEHAAAKAAGDTARANELGREGPWLQERMHMQGFGNLPVDDILEGREEMMAGVAEAAGVDIIVPNVDWMGDGVETVDVTEALMIAIGMAEADAKQMMGELRKVEPVTLPFDFGDH